MATPKVQTVTATSGVGIGQSAPINSRPDISPDDGAGLRVTLRRKSGLTRAGHLTIPFHFQCPPSDSFTWEEAYDHQEFQTLRAGTFSRPAGRSLATVTFSTLFVAFDAYAADGPRMSTSSMNWHHSYGLIDPFWMTEEVRSLQRTGTPFWLYVGQPSVRDEWDVKMLATLRSMRVEERAGEPDAKYADMQFSEYRQVTVSRKSKTRPRSQHRSRTRSITLTIDGTRHRVDPDGFRVQMTGANNDELTLVHIAHAAFGDAQQWPFIKAYNKLDRWGGHADLFDYMVRHKMKRLRLRIPADSLMQQTTLPPDGTIPLQSYEATGGVLAPDD